MGLLQVMPLGTARAPAVETENTGDQSLVDRARAGDLEAFEQLFRETHASVAGIVARLIERPDDVDDVVQDVYLQAYQRLDAFRGDARFSTWIYRIAVNTSLKRRKQLKLRNSASLDDPDTGLADRLESNPDEAPPDRVLKQERETAVRNAVAALPEKHRVVVTLRYFEDLSCEEIARILNCSVGTVWSRLHYASKQLQKSLKWLQEF